MNPYTARLHSLKHPLNAAEASSQMEHVRPESYSQVGMIDGLDIFLLGCIAITSPNGQTHHGTYAIKTLQALTKDDSQLFETLNNRDTDTVFGFKIVSRPWFEVQDRDGNSLCAPFYELPLNPAELSEIILTDSES